MKKLTDLPNLGNTLSQKLIRVGITSGEELVDEGSINALERIATLEGSGVCLNMLYALEGAIQGLRWHHLPLERKQELKAVYQSFMK